ncbi:radical S-adenosyl methionine domain-containing protein 1 [Kappamyces sp. JEL0829]|nr:radical S-adenosyl methionine domain-containing protein 1 [Kappamyces sp. JEL0829]
MASIYIHFPWCLRLCSYCSFNKYVLPSQSRLGSFVECVSQDLLWELAKTQPQHRRIASIYFGGGTPSLADASLVEKVLEICQTHAGLERDAEITLEVNPTGTSEEKLAGFRAAGVNRISMGIQALHDDDLAFFDRDHTVKDALATLGAAQRLFHNISLDFIWGRPSHAQPSRWEKELEQIEELGAQHLSLYQLTVERGTRLFNDVKMAKVQLPSPDTMADLFELTRRRKKYQQYEVSSFHLDGLPHFKSTHNSGYWSGRDYIGVGPGAHSAYHLPDGSRWRAFRILAPAQWQQQVRSQAHGVRKTRRVSPQQFMQELVMVGIRTVQGVDLRLVASAGKGDVAVDQVLDATKLALLKEKGLVIQEGDWIRTTHAGLALADRIGCELLL